MCRRTVQVFKCKVRGGTRSMQCRLVQPAAPHLAGWSPPSMEKRPSCPAEMAALTPARSMASRPDSVRGLTCAWQAGGGEVEGLASVEQGRCACIQ